MLPPQLADIVSRVIYNVDCKIRHHMVNRAIDLNERAYMGALTYGCIDEFDRNAIPYFSLTMNARDNHSTDLGYAFKYGNQMKFAICEAKLIRFTTTGGNYRRLNTVWDRCNNGVSRFSRQIINNQNRTNAFCFFYHFAKDLPLHDDAPLDPLGSTCVKRDEMFNIFGRLKKYNVSLNWTLDDLIDFQPNEVENLQTILYNFLICKLGKPFTIYGNYAQWSDETGKINIPLPMIKSPNEKGNLNQSKEIKEFMHVYKLKRYLYFDITNAESLLRNNFSAF